MGSKKYKIWSLLIYQNIWSYNLEYIYIYISHLINWKNLKIRLKFITHNKIWLKIYEIKKMYIN